MTDNNIVPIGRKSIHITIDPPLLVGQQPRIEATVDGFVRAEEVWAAFIDAQKLLLGKFLEIEAQMQQQQLAQAPGFPRRGN